MTNAIDIAAADWAARLSGEPGEADWLAFEAWLQAPGRRAAYDRALAVWLAVDGQAEALAAAIADRVDEEAAAPPGRAGRRGPSLWRGAGMSGVAALAVTVAVLNPQKPVQPHVYSTARGQHREVVLSDGTKVALNTGTTLSVRRTPHAREITLARGEAAFEVTHDVNRPFTVHAGDRVLQDIGTVFDVTREDGLMSVTVREGVVAVQRADSAQGSLKLSAGMRLEHREGAPYSAVLAADTEQAFAWRSGRLIYRDRPLAEVAADLARYGDDEVKVSGPAAKLRFSGVLTIDSEPAMVARLSDLLPLTAARKDGVITLSELSRTR